MNITLALVTSTNGKLTNGNDPNIYAWTSPEDQNHFFALIDKHSLIIMGRKTYESAKEKIRLQENKLRVVMTTHPEGFSTQGVRGQLEFTDESPVELVDRFEKLGYTKILLVGGSDLAALFFRHGLVDTILLTIEPKLFGTGTHFIDGESFSCDLSLTHVKQLNKKGTLLLEYSVDH